MLERATVLAVNGNEVRFVIERLTGPSGAHIGIVLLPVGSATTSTSSGHSHTLDVNDLDEGDDIVIGSVGRDPDDWIVLGRYP